MSSDLQLMLSKANTAYARAKPEKAAELYARASELDSSCVVARFWHGTSLCQIGANMLERKEDAAPTFHAAEEVFAALHDLDVMYGENGLAQIARCEALR